MREKGMEVYDIREVQCSAVQCTALHCQHVVRAGG